MAKRPPDDTPPTRLNDAARQLVFRKCPVCEWHGEVVESPGAASDCPWCHAPTDRVSVEAQVNPGEKNPHAAALGRLGGSKGGYARAEALTAKQRRDIALKAARARWREK